MEVATLQKATVCLSMVCLLAGCTDGEERVRRLAERGDVNDLINVLEGSWITRDATRASAAWELGFAGDERALPSLISALRDGNCLVRIAAAEALDTLGWKPHNDEVAISFWLGMLSGRRLADRDRAVDQLGRTGASAVGPLIDLLGVGAHPECYGITEGTILTFQRIGEAAVESLIAKLGDQDTYVRRDAAEALGRIGSARAVAPLIKALEDRRETVRQHAVVALANTAALASRRVGVEVAAFEPESAELHPIVLLDGIDRRSSPYPQLGEPR